VRSHEPNSTRMISAPKRSAFVARENLIFSGSCAVSGDHAQSID
jgi:hypothetical protein